ncbi:DUF1810 domain-containing protein [Pseudorhodoferax sp. Leaf267]|uniref:DUF1810 domain-containing protein n=1 Tax=Pseudorhodoferax sp. Leaf267 TaxID=1736316 RepID=UPI0006FE28D8|nr:DUF1810 domain-containing protein [Pseudorhodoferax sp. Leaf267]KQP11937.1 calpastatin [Pseudorhodoferax sp. Leaf267]
MQDTPDLTHFVDAQAPVWPQVQAELRAGRKTSHWMWFIFPQHVALGHSPMARRFGLASLAEAQAYLAHPVLGPRLLQATALVLAVRGRSAHDIFGSPDDLKLRSSMTLFQTAAPEQVVFGQVLDRYYAGQADEKTLALLR